MSRTATCLSVLILTEDSGAQAFETLRSLVKELLKQVDEFVQTHRISFEPVRDEQALQSIHANLWKSTRPKDRQKRVELIRTLATQVMLEDGWAFFHFDGDRAWAARGTSENREKFQTLVGEGVHQLVMEKLKRLMLGASAPELEAHARERMTRLKTVVPFYSIEAWLFQNTGKAIELCQLHHGGRHVEQFEAWALDRASLDELLKPKESACLGAAHNLDLVSDFPARKVREAGKSFAATVDELDQDASLRDALARTYAYG